MAKKGIRGQELADEILRVSDNLEGEFRREFLNAVSELAENKELKKLLAEIDSGNFNTGDSIDTRLRSVTIDTSKLDAISRKAMGSAARISGKTVSALKPAFNVTNPSVISVARKMSIDLSTNLTKSTKEVLRNIIQNAVEGNISRVQASKQIRQYVGLLPAHKSAVDKYLDSMIQNGVKPALAQKRADKYAQRLLKYRSETISRTEVARAVGEGQTAMWKQMRDDNLLPPESKRVWITGYDERVCAICGPMDGVEADIDGFWTTSRGMSEYPSQTHPNCRCTSGIVISKPSTKKSKLKKVDELEYEHWVLSKFNPNHDEKGRFASADGNTRSFGDESEVFGGSSGLQKSALESGEKYVLDKYVRDGYKQINGHLRRTTEVGDSPREKFIESAKAEKVALMDAVFKKTAVSCKRDMYVHRGMTLAVDKKKSAESWVAKLKVGDTMTDKGFVSTSSEKGTARTFATSGVSMGVLFTIKVPKGKKVMAGLSVESELIMNRGTKFKVVGKREFKVESGDMSPNFEIELEML